MGHKKKTKTRIIGSGLGLVVTGVLFIAILAMLAGGTFRLAQGADAEGVAATKQAIERATVTCYATEGFYPPGLGYIEEHYGVQIDRSRYSVRYEVYAYNVMPVIRVAAR